MLTDVCLTSCIGYKARATARGLVIFDTAGGSVQARCAVCCTDDIAQSLLECFQDCGEC